MGWQPVPGAGIDSEHAAQVGTQAGTFLIQAIQAEVAGARIDPIQVLIDPDSPRRAVYAVTAVAGPVRNYLATAWGGALHVAHTQIVSRGTIEACRQAVQAVLHQRMVEQDSSRAYEMLGAFTGDEAGTRK